MNAESLEDLVFKTGFIRTSVVLMLAAACCRLSLVKRPLHYRQRAIRLHSIVFACVREQVVDGIRSEFDQVVPDETDDEVERKKEQKERRKG